ncbi:MAG TPA: hypothetical protein VGQ57_13300, partial [Polyangiaceae bacterium]|nr:hypothetical protein [Polyangiaceae bacterium]
PRLVGRELAPEIVREALVRLGADYAWEELEPKLGRTSELAYFSLDLASEGRVKVYVAHPGATAADIDRVVRDTSGYHPGLAQRWIEELTGSPGPFEARPILTSHAFRSPLHAAEVTVHVPAQSYVADDAQALQRIAELLGPEARRLRAGVDGMARRPLELGRGLLATVALRPVANGTRLTATLSPEAHAIATSRRVLVASEETAAPASERAELGAAHREEPVDAAPPSGQCFDVVLRFIARSATLFSTHPLLERLEGEGSGPELRVLAPHFACYLLWHEDLLRRGALLTPEPEVRAFASACEADELAHKHELLNELAELGAPPRLAWTFAPEHAAIRDASYELASLLANASADVTRLAMLRALEAGGGEFLVRAVAYFERLGRSAGVGTFAHVHELLERDHEVFDAAAQSRLEVLPVPDRVMHEVFMAVERTFEAIGRLCDAIEAKMPDAALPGGLRAAG